MPLILTRTASAPPRTQLGSPGVRQGPARGSEHESGEDPVRSLWGSRAGRVVLVVVLVLAAAVTTHQVIDRVGRTDLHRALAALPDDVRRVSFTDWSAVREQVGADLGSDPSRDAVEQMAVDLYEEDLGSGSALEEAAGAMHELLGFGPATARWEVLGQSPEGSAVVLSMPDSTDFDQIESSLRSAGYTAPEGGDEGVWEGGIDLVAALDPALNPVVQYVVLRPGAGLVVASDTVEYAAAAAAPGSVVGAAPGVSDLADRLAGTVVSALWVGDFACEDLAMARADADDQARAAARIEELGGLNPLQGLAMGLTPEGTVRVVAHLPDADRAESDLEARAELAVGEAYGRSGSFSDDYELTRARTVGSDVVLDLTPLRTSGFALSGLYSGPVVFASC